MSKQLASEEEKMGSDHQPMIVYNFVQFEDQEIVEPDMGNHHFGQRTPE